VAEHALNYFASYLSSKRNFSTYSCTKALPGSCWFRICIIRGRRPQGSRVYW